jgi:DNA polymerase-1
MLKIAQEMPKRIPDARMILQVHDELVFECSKQDAVSVANLAQTMMEDAYTLTVPLKVDVAIGRNWDQMDILE